MGPITHKSHHHYNLLNHTLLHPTPASNLFESKACYSKLELSQAICYCSIGVLHDSAGLHRLLLCQTAVWHVGRAFAAGAEL
jgi:hypothetical protein